MALSKDLEDFIFYKNIFPRDIIDGILNEYKENLFDRDSHHNKISRHLGELDISDRSLINSKNSYVRQKLFVEIKDQVEVLIEEYKKYILPYGLPIVECSPFSLRQMHQGDYYEEHNDDGVGSATGEHKITVSICLNENYEGGEFTFFQESLIYTLKKGDVLMFPSSFQYPHGVKKITKGTRYQLVLWLR